MNFALTVVAADLLAVGYSYSIIRPFLTQAAPHCFDALELASRYYSSISQSLTYIRIQQQIHPLFFSRNSCFIQPEPAPLPLQDTIYHFR
jgi:hypothetical protein